MAFPITRRQIVATNLAHRVDVQMQMLEHVRRLSLKRGLNTVLQDDDRWAQVWRKCSREWTCACKSFPITPAN